MLIVLPTLNYYFLMCKYQLNKLFFMIIVYSQNFYYYNNNFVLYKIIYTKLVL